MTHRRLANAAHVSRTLSLAAFGAAAFITAAVAQPPGAQISIDDALRIARQSGLATITKIERDHRKWEAEGRDGSGHRIELDIDATSGAVLKTERK
ncbi:PepSY domain-containing protein [Ancylobacter sp. 6x-1]|uniref:PepSY domain-containing protein n=1 Tax=Ancylobacter crimeensis TaxID=2579147 RepID=A0ABT0DEP6_9HYPH|nr:PepSY domain-containing protein [Ancylobacter crimeensis]MCK0198423.1 PepSY domain-containing protein [Ancylobacter crimeensis]